MKNEYYHITNIKNEANILKEGLRADSEGQIFLFDKLEIKLHHKKGKIFIADHIALNQVILEKYLLIRIDSKGITGNILPDNVSEFTAKHQFILKQDYIKPQYLKIIEKRTTKNDLVKTLYGIDMQNFNLIDEKTNEVTRIRNGNVVDEAGNFLMTYEEYSKQPPHTK